MTTHTTRDGRQITAWQCPHCRVWFSGSGTDCPNCRDSARDAQKTAIAADVATDTGKDSETPPVVPPNVCIRESDTQKQVEAWLIHAGYWPRSPKYLTGDRPPRGWYIHVHEAQGNPILLDLLVLDFARGWYEIELKSARGRVRDAQVRILEASQGHAVLCRSAQDAIDYIRLRFEMA